MQMPSDQAQPARFGPLILLMFVVGVPWLVGVVTILGWMVGKL